MASPITFDRATRLLARHFGELTPAPDTSRAQPGTIVDPEGRVWPLRCRCGRHPHSGHDARPVHRQ